LVKERLRRLFLETGTRTVVSSAACGADLIALEIAEELHLGRRIVLPFDARRFRDVSVTDRPGDWGAAFDRIVESARAAGDLMILDPPDGAAAADNDVADLAATEAILDETKRQAKDLGVPAAAAIVWNGDSRGIEDLTIQFRRRAVARSLRVFEVLTV
jgi:hypothetical protein